MAQVAAVVLSLALGAVSLAAGIHAKKSRHEELDKVYHAAESLGLTINIEDSDIVNGGTAMVAASIVLIVVALFSLIRQFALKRRPTIIEAALYGLTSLWLFVMAVYITVVGKRGSVKTSAFGPTGSPIPQSLIDAQSKAIGVSAKYWDKKYIHFMAIAPWFSFAAALIAAIVLFMASRKATTTTTTRHTAGSSEEKIGHKEHHEAHPETV